MRATQRPRPGATARKLVVVSMDGLSAREWEAVLALPAFSALIARGASSRSLGSVFPSLTYVVHATMMTGRHPRAHGIDHNRPLQPGVPEDSQRWHWYASEVKAPTLFDLAGSAGLTRAAVLWPLVAGARLEWNLPEIAALPGENQTLKALRSGSAPYLLGLQLRFGKYRRGSEQPYLDDFVSRSAAHTIRRMKPDLLMTHLIALDDAKHAAGSDSAEAAAALRSLDAGLARILAAVEEGGSAGETAVAVLGDHGHIDVLRRARPNVLLAADGLCGVEDGRFRWRAWCRCSGGSAFVHVRPGDAEAAARARGLLAGAAEAGAMGIEAILDPGELDRRGNPGGAAFGLAALPGTQFKEDLDGPLVELPPRAGAFGADHGYDPGIPGYRSLFMAAGPGIEPATPLGDLDMVDVAPTLAGLLGLEFDGTDGKAIKEISER